MLDVKHPEIKVEDIMQRIQEKVRATRGAPAARATATIAGIPGIPRWQALDDALDRAQAAAPVGTAVPPMTRLQGFKRTVATGVAKTFLRLAQLITRDQRTFNLTAVDAMRLLQDRARDDAAQLAALRREVETARADLSRDIAQVRASLSFQERRLDTIAVPDSKPKTSAATRPQSPTEGSSTVPDPVYLHFEDEFRGPREVIKERLAVYVPALRAAAASTGGAPILDLGCGRGELLEVIRSEGLRASGVDTNSAAVEECRALGLDVELRDLFDALRSVGDGTLGGLAAIHVIEHLAFPRMVMLIDEALRVLKPGGVVIFETPNPQNVLVGSCTFYVDPTHRNPVHPRTLRFLMQARGMSRVETTMLHPYPPEQRLPDSDSELARRFNDYFYGPQDFAAIGYRP
jgi:SAM-dependent methyltransferase